jgi:hypothetical protein
MDPAARATTWPIGSTPGVGATTFYLGPPTFQAGQTLIYSDRAPSVDRPVLRSPRRAGSSQVLPRHTKGSPYRCSLPGLAGFDDSRCVGPNLQHRPARLIQHEPPSRGDSTPLKRIAGYRAPLTPRLARPRRNLSCSASIQKMAEGVGFEPTAQGLPAHGISSAAPSAARSPLRTSARGKKSWRRGEDLNPRGTFWAPIRFRVGRLQPGSATPPRSFNVVACQRTRAAAPRSRRPAHRPLPRRGG